LHYAAIEMAGPIVSENGFEDVSAVVKALDLEPIVKWIDKIGFLPCNNLPNETAKITA